MKRQRIERSTSRLVLAIGFATTSVLSLSVHGCVRGPHEISSKLQENMSGVDESLPQGEWDEDTAQAADDEGPLLASDTETRFHPIVRVSRGDSRHEGVESEGLLGTILNRRRREQDLGAALGDPFLASTEQPAESVAAGPPGTSGDQSQSEQRQATSTHGSQARFTKDFDARLARLREELNGLDEQATADIETEESPSDRPFWAHTPETPQSPPSQSPHGAAAPVAETARSATRRAESVVAKQDSAATENDTDRLIEKLPRTSREGETGGDRANSSPSVDAHFGEMEKAAQNVGWTDSPEDEDVELVHATEAVATREEPITSDGGVRLLAPIDDSFSAASDELVERIRTGTMRRNRPGTDFMSGFTWPDEPGRVDGLSVLKHAESTNPPVMDGDSGAAHAISLLANDGHSSRFSNVGSRQMRILEPRSADNWLTPAPSTTRSAEVEDREPVQVAGAPPLLLELETAASPQQQRGSGSKAPLRAKGVRSGWASQIPWFIGGLILLLAAMRLISRKAPPKTSAT